jgi:protein-S-isoprenylcysteine O-methyltransferase Ste14
LFVRPVQTTVVTPFSEAVMLFGFLLSLSSKLALNRRFGIVAANRGVQTKWPYSIVRHPMYAGYLITQVGFFITSPTLWNAFVYAIAWTLQILRIFEEEKLLKQDEAYRTFTQRVRYRLVPGLF